MTTHSPPQSTQGIPNPSYFSPWFISLLACFLLSLLFGAHFINDTDLGFHLKGGQWILDHHQFPSNDTFTYTISGQPFLDIHWFYQVCLYLFFQTGGYGLVEIFHILLITAALFFVVKRLRLVGAAWWLCTLLLLTTLLACEIRFRARPEIASWFFLSLTLWVLDIRVQKGRDLLFLLPLIQLFWVNMEGLFVLGWAAMGIYILSGWIHSRRLDKKLLRYSLFAAASALLNPYFFKGLLFPLTNWATMTNPLMRNTIKELQSPWFATPTLFSSPTLYLLLYKVFSVALLILILVTFRKRRIHEILLFLVFFVLSASAFRNIPLFMIACLPLAAASWRDLEWPGFKKFEEKFISGPAAAWSTTLFILGLSLRVLTGAFYISDRRTEQFGLGLDRHTLPVDACEFLEKHHLDGKLLNQLDDGGWLDWKGPQKVFIDCRLDPYGEYMSSMEPGGLTALAEKYRVDILFFSDLNAQWISQLQNQAVWRQVYLDESTVIYLRTGYADQVPELNYDVLTREQGLSPTLLSEIPVLLRETRASETFIDGFFRAPAFPNGLQNMGIFCGTGGRPDKAELFFGEAIRRTQGRYYDFYFNLGLVYEYTGRHGDAVLCMRRVLRDRPQDPIASQIGGTLIP